MLRSDWVDKIFEKLAVYYGRDWLRKWEGIDVHALKQDWAEKLSGFNGQGDAIKYALEHLPEYPPNVGQFRDLCRRAPKVERNKLPPPNLSAEQVAKNRERIAQLLSKIKTVA